MHHESDRTEAFRRRLAALARRLHDLGPGSHHLASAAAHLTFLALAALALPALTPGPDDARPDEAARWIRQALSASAERDLDARPDPTSEPDADGRMRAQTRCGERFGGSSGDVAYEETRHRVGIKGPADNPDPHLAKHAWQAEWTFWPRVAVFSATWGADPDAPSVLYGREDALGNDPRSARGSLWGDEIGMALGAPGIGASTRRICWRCGDAGLGIRVEGTARAGATDTESVLMATAHGATLAHGLEPGAVGIVTRKPPF